MDFMVDILVYFWFSTKWTNRIEMEKRHTDPHEQEENKIEFKKFRSAKGKRNFVCSRSKLRLIQFNRVPIKETKSRGCRPIRVTHNHFYCSFRFFVKWWSIFTNDRWPLTSNRWTDEEKKKTAKARTNKKVT